MDYQFESSLTYDDVLVKPGHSEILPSEVVLGSRFSRNSSLNIPIVSAAMDTVTEAEVAIVMAQGGGIGVIHKNMTPERQAREVQKVKKAEAGTMSKAEEAQISEELQKMQQDIMKSESKMQQDLLKKEEEYIKPILENLKKTITSVAKAKGYRYVYNKNAMIYYPPSDDITSAVKAKLGYK